jgi:hypothetical protein
VEVEVAAKVTYRVTATAHIEAMCLRKADDGTEIAIAARHQHKRKPRHSNKVKAAVSSVVVAAALLTQSMKLAIP